MATEPVFRITYWGVTGTLSAPLRPEQVRGKIVDSLERLIREGRLQNLSSAGDLRSAIEAEVDQLPFHLRSTFGGNTTCVEVETPDALIILDCGSGFRELGRRIQQRWNSPESSSLRQAHVLITHPHMDHTLATPFFAPYYDPRNSIRVWGARETLDSLRAVLSPTSDLSNVYFPPTFDLMKGIEDLVEIEADQKLSIGSTTVQTASLSHPGGCLAFRLECQGRVFVFATDNEQLNVPDPTLVELAKGADLLYTEGQYTQAEYEGEEGIPGEPPLSRKGWGHSPVEACARTGVAAGVKRLHIGHRDPARTDEALAAIQQHCQDLLQKLIAPLQPDYGSTEVLIPYEGMTVEL